MPAYFGQITLNGSYHAQIVNNMLWYYIASTSDDPVVVASDLAGSFIFSLLDSWMQPTIQDYYLEKIQTQVYENNWTRLLSAPRDTSVGANGVINAESDGPASYRVISAVLNLSTGSGYSGSNRPGRGYLAYGPISNAAINKDGSINPGAWGTGIFATLCTDLAADLGDFGTGQTSALPIRVARPNGAGERGWCKVTEFIPRNYARWRYSRTYGN